MVIQWYRYPSKYGKINCGTALNWFHRCVVIEFKLRIRASFANNIEEYILWLAVYFLVQRFKSHLTKKIQNYQTTWCLFSYFTVSLFGWYRFYNFTSNLSQQLTEENIIFLSLRYLCFMYGKGECYVTVIFWQNKLKQTKEVFQYRNINEEWSFIDLSIPPGHLTVEFFQQTQVRVDQRVKPER